MVDILVGNTNRAAIKNTRFSEISVASGETDNI